MLAYFAALGTSLISLLLSFWYPLPAWIPIVLLEAYFGYVLGRVRRMPVPELTGLSPRAQELLRGHPHFYMMPWAGDDFRKGASAAGTVGLVVGIVGVFKGSWLSLGISVVNLFAMMAVARAFNPTGYLSADYEAAHDELIDHFAALDARRR